MRRRLIIRLRRGLVVLCMCLVACVVLDSCSSSKKTVSGSEAMRVEKSKDKKDKKQKKPKAGRGASHALADALVDEARTWIGTPYRYGGKTKKGADCSGFIMEVYRKVAGISIPRNSAKQKEYCADIDKEDLTVGDLVFFSSKRSGGRIAHVGMYIGDGMMIHASSSRGVIETSIDGRYYVEHYKGSGRIPLIAELVPVKRTTTPADKPTDSEASQYADSDRKPNIEVENKPEENVRPIAEKKEKPSMADKPDKAKEPEKPTTKTPEAVVRDAFGITKKK